MVGIVQVVAAIVSAVLLWAAFPPCGETAGLVVALTPLLAVARLAAPKRAAGVWLLGGAAFWFATLAWMPAIVKNGGPWPLVVLGWLGLAAYCAGYFALFGWLDAHAWRLTRRWADRYPMVVLVPILLVEPLAWAYLEWVRGTVLTGFAWNFLGTGLAHVPGLAAPAKLGGVYLVSGLVVLVNGVFATLVCRLVAQMRRQPRPAFKGARLLRSAETALPLLAVLLVYGAAQTIPATPIVQTLRVALVQRNMPCLFKEKDPLEEPIEIYDRLLETAAAARPDLVVWAESAMCEFGKVSGANARHMARRVSEKTGGAALLAGGDDVETVADGRRRVYNAAALYTMSSDADVTVNVYAKQHLVPFGEYIPFDKWITPLQKLSPVGVSIWPGEPKTLELPVRGRADAERASVTLAPLICFEDTDPRLARQGARMGAQVFVLITNDSWFSRSTEAEQHAWQAVMRAVETGLPVIRVGNSGVTGVVTPDAKTQWLGADAPRARPAVDVPGTMVAAVPVPARNVLTPYTRWGDLPLHLLVCSTLAVFLFLARRGTTVSDFPKGQLA